MAKKILVIVDYQNDFVDGALGFPGADAICAGICRKAEEARKQGAMVFITLDTHDEGYLTTREGKALPVEHCRKGTVGHALYGDLEMLAERIEAVLVEKPAFGSLALVERMSQLCPDAEEIELCGVVTNMCVIANAVLLQSAFPNAEITIDASLCLSFDPALHEKALDVMEGMQMHVINRTK